MKKLEALLFGDLLALCRLPPQQPPHLGLRALLRPGAPPGLGQARELRRRLLPVPVAARLRGALRVHHWAPLRLGFAGLVVVLVVVVVILVLRQRRRRSALGRRLLPPPLDRAPLDDRHELVAETREVP